MSEKLEVDIEPTPNPNALKFVLNKTVKNEGNSTYRSPMECGENAMALSLFSIRGVDQLHFFENVITITKFAYEPWDNVETQVLNVLNDEIKDHNPDYFDPDPEKERREKLSPELLKIEEIFDTTLRPSLQADGGDIQAINYEDHILLIKYMGACGTCPSSATGTLEAVKSILRDEFDPDIDVFIAPTY